MTNPQTKLFAQAIEDKVRHMTKVVATRRARQLRRSTPAVPIIPHPTKEQK